jgi:hypothetical protein
MSILDLEKFLYQEKYYRYRICEVLFTPIGRPYKDASFVKVISLINKSNNIKPSSRIRIAFSTLGAIVHNPLRSCHRRQQLFIKYFLCAVKYEMDDYDGH